MLFNLGLNLQLMDKATQPLRRFRQDVSAMRSSLQGVDTASARLRVTFQTVASEIRSATNETRALRDQAEAIQKTSKNMVMQGAAMAAAPFAMGREAMGFERGLAQIATLTDMSVQEFSDRYANQLRGIARDFGQTHETVLQAMYDAVGAGIAPDDAIGVLQKAAQAAIAGVTDIQTARMLAGSVRSAFGLGPEAFGQIFDVLFATMRDGVTTIEQMAASFSSAGSIAASAGVSLEHMQASVAQLTKVGVPTSTAYIQVANAISSLMSPTTQARKAFDELGIEMNAAVLRSNDLLGSFDIILAAVKDLDEATRADFISQIFSDKESRNLFLNFAAMRGEFIALADRIQDSAGAAGDAFSKMALTADFQYQRLNATFRDLRVTLGTAVVPGLNMLFGLLVKMLTPLALLAERFPRLTGAVLALVMGVGGAMALVGAIGFLASGFMQAWTAAKVLLVAVRAVGIAMAANPIGLIALGIAAAAALIIANWSRVRTFFASLWRGVTAIFSSAWETMQEALRWSPIGLLMRMWGPVSDFIESVFTDPLGTLLSLPQRFAEAGAAIINGLVDGILGAAAGPVEAIKSVVGRVRDFLPFSPAKEGPLQDLDRVRIVETFAEGMNPTPAVEAMRMIGQRMMEALPFFGRRSQDAGQPARAAFDGGPLPMPAPAGAGVVELTYSPTLNFYGGTGASQESFREQLRRHVQDIHRMLQEEQARDARLRF